MWLAAVAFSRMGATGILQLNDYCLEMTLPYLSMEDQISFAQACQRFRGVFLAWSRREYVSISIVGEVLPLELRLLSLSAMSVKKLSIYCDDLVSCFDTQYPNRSQYILIMNFCRLIKSMRNLQFVKIWQGGRHSVSKRVLRVLKDSSQLRQLHICTPKLETRDVRKLEQLEIFSIDVDLTAKGLLHSCRTMTNLRTLHITDQVSSARLREVLVHLPHIRDLSFCINRCVSKHSKLLDCCRDASSSLSRLFDFLASQRSTLVALSVKGPICAVHEAESLVRIKSLKSLDCNFSSPDFVLLLRELPSLRVLRITYLQPIDISYAYLHLVRQCRELRFLRIFDYNINPDFVRKASEVLEDVEAKKPLQLLIHGRHSSTTLREFTSMAEDRKNLLFRSITASELFTLI